MPTYPISRKALILAILKQSVAGLAALALLAPSVLSAKVDCDTLHALMSSDARDLARIAVVFNADWTLDVTHRGKADILWGATQCEMVSPSDGLELSCQWDFDGDYQAARSQLSVMRTQIDACLPEPLTDMGEGVGVEGLAVPFRYMSEIESTDDPAEEIRIDLELYRWTRYDPSRYSVEFSISR